MKENFSETFKPRLEKNKNVIHRPGSVRIGRNCALGLRPRAVRKTSGIVSPNTDRPRPVNNIYVFHVYKDVKPKKCKFFTVFVCEKPKLLYLIIKKSSK